jgi:hypothetical protein
VSTDHSDGYFYTQLFTSSSLSVRMHATYSPNILRRQENSLYRKRRTVYSHLVITQEVHGPVSAERSNAQSIAILLASIKTSVVYMSLTLSKFKVKINLPPPQPVNQKPCHEVYGTPAVQLDMILTV